MNPASLAGHAIELLEILWEDPRPADHLIDKFFRSRRYLGSHDRRELAESVYGILRHQRLLQTLVSQVRPESARNPAWLFVAFKLHIEKLSLDLVANYISGPSPHKLSPSLSELAQIAAQNPETFKDNPGIHFSFPDWFVAIVQQQFGEAEGETLLASLNQPPPLTIRVNTLQTSRANCLLELQKLGFDGKETALSAEGLHLAKRMNLFNLDLFRAGWFEVQDEGSQIVSLLLDPKPTWRVADVCAGGGGKTLHLAALMKNRGEIFAFDVAPKRLEQLQKRSRRSGMHNIRVHVLQENEAPASLPGKMDAILIDAPCSGSGVLRRNPDAKWKITPGMVEEMSAKQQQILRHYAPLLKPGGRLVYATCSVLAQENEAVVQSFLEGNPSFQAADAAAILQRYQLSHLAQGGAIHLLPHKHGCDGFFAMVMERRLA